MVLLLRQRTRCRRQSQKNAPQTVGASHSLGTASNYILNIQISVSTHSKYYLVKLQKHHYKAFPLLYCERFKRHIESSIRQPAPMSVRSPSRAELFTKCMPHFFLFEQLNFFVKLALTSWLGRALGHICALQSQLKPRSETLSFN